MLKDIWFLIIDILVSVKFFILGLFDHDPPEGWIESGHTDVILIPGFSESWILMRKLGLYFNDKGYRVHVLKELGNMYDNVEELADMINNYTNEHGLKKYYLVTHSKGGKVAKYYAQNHANDIKVIIFIATPHHGSFVANLNILNLDQLKIESDFIKELCGHVYHGVEILNIYGRIDNFILPNSSLVLNVAGENNIQIDVVGHTRILEDNKTFGVIEGFLNEIEEINDRIEKV